MNTNEVIRQRRSVRKYKKDMQVKQEDLDTILEAGMCAPSACNSRPWQFVVVRNQEVKEEITKIQPFCKFLPDASLGIVVCANPDALKLKIEGGFWQQDCAAATQNILLQATELGYGTCWCGVYPDKNCSEKLAKLLDVQTIPFGLIVLGVPDEQPKMRGFYDKERVKYI